MSRVRIGLIIFGVIVLIVFALVAHALFKGNDAREEAYADAQAMASESADMVVYDDFYMYRGNEAWDVIVGKDSEGDQIGVWIPAGDAEGESQEGYILPMDDAITEEQAVEITKSEKDVEDVVSVELGMEDEQPLWEITYINSKDKYCYYYIDAVTGELIKSFENI